MPAIAGLIVILARENATAVLVMIFPLLAPQLAMRTLEEVRSGIRSAIEMLADTVEERDQETAYHASRVANYAQAIIEEMPHIPHKMTETIVAAARIHDLGKVGVRDLALHRPGPLTAEQRREMDRHTVIGGEIVKQIRGYELTSAIIRGHHERWDGAGYPDKLSGEQIPIGSRIIAVADAFDAMTSDRPYRKAMRTDAALRELSLNSGTQFDPAVVAAFTRALGHAPLHDWSVQVASPQEVPAS
jgi:HD-GYP domain-containing protein (c-di-GMP phosphodiesterase class II)